MSKSLFTITRDLEALDDLLNESGGDISAPGAAEALDSILAELAADFESKADAYAALISVKRARAKARREEAQRLMAIVAADENAAKGLAERLKLVMEQRGMKKVDTARYRLSVCGNGGLAPLTLLAEPEQMPAWAQVIKKEANTTAIRERIAAGEPVEFARIEPRGTHLRIA